MKFGMGASRENVAFPEGEQRQRPAGAGSTASQDRPDGLGNLHQSDGISGSRELQPDGIKRIPISFLTAHNTCV